MLTDLYDRLAYSPTAGIALGFVVTMAIFLVWLAIRPLVRNRFRRAEQTTTPRPAPPRTPKANR